MSTQIEQNLVSERAQSLLKALVERHIQDGHPVGSKTLANQLDLHLSPATIRNVMAELEDQGFIRSVHTSSGRVPTAQGYRFFVDSLLVTKPVNEDEVTHLKQGLNQPQSSAALVQTVSKMLSNLTHLTGVVTLPKKERLVLRHAEFLPLSQKRVLVILVVDEAEVQNRIIDCDREYTSQELQQVSNYFNAELCGLELAEIRRHIIEGMQQDKAQLDSLTQMVINLAENALNPNSEEQDCIVEGEANLLDVMDNTPTQKLRDLLSAFAHKREMLRLFDQCLRADGIHIFIGAESGYKVFDDCTLVTAPYKAGDIPVGVLGVIGPTRMAYERVIPLVDVTAKLLSVVLTRSKQE